MSDFYYNVVDISTQRKKWKEYATELRDIKVY